MSDMFDAVQDQSQIEYLRIQIVAFEELKTQQDRQTPYYGYDSFSMMKCKQERDRLEGAIERRFKDIVSVAEDTFKKPFPGDNKALIVSQIVKAMGGLQPPEQMPQPDNINPLR